MPRGVPDGGKVGFIGRDRGGRRTSEIFIIDAETGAMQAGYINQLRLLQPALALI